MRHSRHCYPQGGTGKVNRLIPPWLLNVQTRFYCPPFLAIYTGLYRTFAFGISQTYELSLVSPLEGPTRPVVLQHFWSLRVAECLYQGNWRWRVHGYVYKESHLEAANMSQSGSQWLNRADEDLVESTQYVSGERALTPKSELRAGLAFRPAQQPAGSAGLPSSPSTSCRACDQAARAAATS
jgi:hypothetical protein